MITVIIFILILGVLIFVHELGHFVVARRNGIKADEFGFGLPPRVFGVIKNEKSGKYEFIWGGKQIESKNTLFSLNWIPLGGFVKIKGENSDSKEGDSFAVKPAWVRAKVLGAGVIMNLLLAWFLLSIVFILGAPRAINDVDKVSGARVQISQVAKETPAESMGLLVGDEVLRVGSVINGTSREVSKISELKKVIDNNTDKEITLTVKRGNEVLNLTGVPLLNHPDNQGALGVQLTRTALIKYTWYEAIGQGLLSVLNLMWLIIATLGSLIVTLISGAKSSVELAGPIGIAFMTKQVAALGLVYILQFTAILSVNLAIINAFPFPALDGGRILFILIEKIKGSPVSQKVEQIAHTTGFALLLLLMVVITFQDFINFEIFSKIVDLF